MLVAGSLSPYKAYTAFAFLKIVLKTLRVLACPQKTFSHSPVLCCFWCNSKAPIGTFFPDNRPYPQCTIELSVQVGHTATCTISL